VRSLFRDEVMFVSRDSSLTRAPVGVATLAGSPLILYDITHGFNDPTRRQLAARAQEAGALLEARIEVEHVETALQLVGRGLGSTIAARAVLAHSVVPEGVTAVGFAEPFYDFFAVVTRRGVRVSPATRALLDLVDEWAETVSARL
jgi:DNA-binding transcriptional LysR family regulator